MNYSAPPPTASAIGAQPLDADLTERAAVDPSALGLTLDAVADAAAGRNALGASGGVWPIATLGTGTPDGTKFLRDDGTLVAPTSGITPGFGIEGTGAAATPAKKKLRRYWDAGTVGSSPYCFPTQFGVTARGSVVDSGRTDYVYAKHTSAASSANGGLWCSGTFAHFKRGHEPRMRGRIRTDTVLTVCRFTFGFVNSESPTPTHKACIEYDTSRADTGWKLVTKDGTAENVVDMALAIAADTEYEWEIWIEAGVAYAKINASATASNASNLPGASAFLGWQVGVYTIEAVAKAIHINCVHGESK